VGLKPTWGRVSRHGLVAFASSLDQVGPLAADVLDAALALALIAGPDRHDATCASRAVEDYPAAARRGAAAVAGRRVGVLRQADDRLRDAAARRVWRAGLDRLRALGCDLVEVSAPAADSAVAAYQVLANAEASANLARFDGVRYGRRASGVRTAHGSAPSSLDDLYRDSRSEGFGREVKRRVLLGTFVLSAGYHESYYGRARALAARLRRELAAALETVSWIVTPTAPGGAFHLGARLDDPVAMVESDVFTTPASLAGLPALALPAGLDDDGLPLSLQIVGRAFDESGVLALGHAFETARGPFPRPPEPPAAAF
jgi:aspartyl-tRNA(Asn)/glutamyl-tRNA(Gln) amidotransferase subunit A